MRRFCAISLILIFSITSCFADFKYTEKSKVTGGSMMGAVKFAGAFSKDAKQITQGMNSTLTFKGNKMRRDDDLGNAEIYDLDGRRIIHIDTRHKTYSVITFDEMRARIQEERRKAAEQQAKSKDKNAQVTITPKVQITAGSGTKELLGQTAKETKIRVEMEVQSDDPKNKGQSGTFWATTDSWLAPVKGADEVKRFYTRLAKELDWLPGEMAAGGNVQIAPAMSEIHKDVANLKGLPLLQYISIGGSGTGQPGQSDSKAESSPSTPGGAIAKGIGGLFGKKKKKEDEQSKDSASTDSKPASPANSLMDMTVEVTSISTDPVDKALFDIPEGYKQVEDKGRH